MPGPDSPPVVTTARWCRGFVALLYLCRFPILSALTLFFFPILAGGGLQSIAGGAFELSRAAVFYVSLAGFLHAWTILVTARLVRLYGPHRFVELRNLRREDENGAAPGRVRRWWLTWRGHFIAGLLVVPLLHRIYVTTIGEPSRAGLFQPPLPAGPTGRAVIAWMALGFVMSMFVLWLIQVLHRLLLPRESREKSVLFPASAQPSWVDRWAQQTDLLRSVGLRGAVDRRLGTLARLLGPGYAKPDQNGEPRLAAGHSLALIQLAASFALYFVLQLPRQWRWFDVEPSSLAYLIAAMILLCWGLSGLAFLFDRWRVPVLVLILAWFLAVSKFTASDHSFPVLLSPPSCGAMPTPEEVVGDRETMIVVATSGGGIRSAAWTARVLTGLETLARADPELRKANIRFVPNVRLLSGVSGGSTGMLHFLGALDPKTGELESGDAVVAQAERSSLDALAWGLVYPDMRRALAPFLFPPKSDRGLELQREWRRATEEAGGLLPPRLSDWHDRVRAGIFPAVIFNATDAVTGERVLLGTTIVDPAGPRGRKNFCSVADAYHDLAPETAARMSATFPFLSPAARPDQHLPGEFATPLVDGGYADNFGMATLMEWVFEARVRSRNLRRVLVIQIRAAPEVSQLAPRGRGGRGWLYQLYVPLEAMLSVWSNGQSARNDAQFELLRRAWKSARPETKPGAAAAVDEIRTAYFEFKTLPDREQALPLSWHLTRGQREDVELVWREIVASGAAWNEVRNFLLGRPENSKAQ